MNRKPIQNKEIIVAKKAPSKIKIIGIVLMVIGVGLCIWGYQISGSFGSQMTQAFTGSHTDKVMTLYIGGAASLIVGLYVFMKK